MLVLAASSLMLIEAASAAVPKPSAPEFTAKFVDHSYNMEATSTVDQYTGQTVITPAHRVENYTIEITSKNQQYAPAVVGEGNGNWIAEFRYDVNVKGHFAQNWTIMYLIGEGPKPSNSDYTVITYELLSSPSAPEQGYELRSFLDDAYGSNSIEGIPPNSQLDFRVRASLGAMHRSYNPDATDQLSMYPWVFEGEISNWSSPQTVTIPAAATPESSPVPTLTVDATPYAPIVSGNVQTTDLTLLVIGISVVIAIVVTVTAMVLVKRARKSKV